MLALKDLHLGMKPALTCFADLPAELLSIILHHVYKDDGGTVRNVVACSRTNHAIRDAAAPILFESLAIDIEVDSIAESSLVRLRHVLQKNRSIAYHVRHLKQIFIPPDKTDRRTAADLTDDVVRMEVVQAFRLMTGLRRVS